MLTDTKIRSLKPRERLYRVADAGGLCIEVPPNGTRLWRFRYRFAGRAGMLSLGAYPTVSLGEARTLRDDARKLVSAGIDPAAFRKAQQAAAIERDANTFGAIAAELLAKRQKEGMGDGSVQRERRLVDKDLASIAGMPIADVTAPLLLAALRKIEARGVIETAHRARALASRVFKYAVITGRADRNPAADLAGALEQQQVKHFAAITDPAQVAGLLRAIDGYNGSPVTVAALKLAALLFVRPGELRSMRWSDVDLDAGEWRYTVTKTNTPHVVPLATQAVAILRELQPLTGRRAFVLPGVRSPAAPLSENTINAALRGLGYDRDTMTGHGFRAMARTILDEVLGFRPDYIEHQLAHAVRDPLGRAYNRTAHLPERRKMMQSWADYLDQLRTGSNVVPLRGRSAG